eukprot:6690631-Heterocapsa_arctica.AAC.1
MRYRQPSTSTRPIVYKLDQDGDNNDDHDDDNLYNALWETPAQDEDHERDLETFDRTMVHYDSAIDAADQDDSSDPHWTMELERIVNLKITANEQPA